MVYGKICISREERGRQGMVGERAEMLVRKCSACLKDALWALPMDSSLPGSSVLACPCLGFSRQEYWSGLPCPPPRIFPNQESNPCLLFILHWQVGSLPLAPPGKSTLDGSKSFSSLQGTQESSVGIKN